MHRLAGLALIAIVLAACSAAPPATSPGAPSPGVGGSGPQPTLVAGSANAAPEPQGVGPGVSRPIGPADIDAAAATWARFAHPAYSLHVRFGCECLLTGDVIATVRDGAVVGVTQDGRNVELASVQGFPLTVEAMLGEARATLDGGGTVTGWFIDSGVPGVLDLDRDPQAIDDELHIQVEGFENQSTP